MKCKILVGKPLANEDIFMNIQAVIDVKRKMLLDKQKLLKKATKTNHFLDTVKDDYTQYYNFIIQQKQDQVKAITFLNKYIEDLTTSGELSENNIEDARTEQIKLLHEVKQIKRGIDSLTTDTTNITNELHTKI